MFLDKRLTKRAVADSDLTDLQDARLASEHCWLLDFSFKNEALANQSPAQEILDALIKCGLPNAVRQDVHTVLNELYVNALDYGVLGMNNLPKSSDDNFDFFHVERQKRLKIIENNHASMHAWIKISCCLNIADRPELEITVADSGNGYLSSETELNKNLQSQAASDILNDNTSCKGRGIQLVKALVSDFRFVGNNNQVKIIYRC